MFDVYGDINSGNCYKIKLLLSLPDIEHRWIHVNILNGESRTPNYLKLNPNGKIPVLLTPERRALFESNAILHYLAAGTAFSPTAQFESAEVLQWQFFEQYSHEPYIATSRTIVRYLNSPTGRLGELDAKKSGGNAALKVMNEHLKERDYFVGERYSIADISLYAYTHVAEEGGFSLAQYSNINTWMKRIFDHPRHVTMQDFPPPN
ncbi:MAG: glutathione S-transferase [Gammaproteobacteria bacterium]|jgi:glutathione S-transferase